MEFTFSNWNLLFQLTYVKKITLNPEKSVLGTNYEWNVKVSDKSIAFTAVHKIILVAVAVIFALYVYGALNLKWGLPQLVALSVILMIFSGLLAKMKADDIATLFVEGCKTAVFSVMLIGIATGISVVLTQGKIIDTIIYYFSLPLVNVSSSIAGITIFMLNWVFNFFVPSGSGQAAVVMPILAPLGDVINLSKSVIVTGYKFGDGITNFIVPTSSTLMGFIGLAGIPYEKWLKFILPLVGIQTILGCLAIIVQVMFGF